MNLIQLLSFVHERLPGDKTVTLICIDSYPGRPNFKGLGELTPGELAPLFDTRQPVTVQQFALAERAWQAFRAPTPEALAQLRHEDTSALPYLAAALTRFLQEYPWTRDGLSRSERRLLELAGGGGIALWQAFPRMDEGERALHTTDHSLADAAETLSQTSPSLLTLDLPPAADVLDGFVTLTAAGRSALAGQLDRVSACGLDRWFGGVHLREGGPMWRWDPARHTVVRTDA